MQSLWTLPVVVVFKSFEKFRSTVLHVIDGVTVNCVTTFHPDTDAHLHEVSTVPREAERRMRETLPGGISHFGHFLFCGVKSFLEVVQVAQNSSAQCSLLLGFHSSASQGEANLNRPANCVCWLPRTRSVRPQCERNQI